MKLKMKDTIIAMPVTAMPIWVLLGLLLIASCDLQEPVEVQVPARMLYFEATRLEDDEIHNEAEDRLKTLIAENPGTRLGTFAYLKLGDLYSKSEDWAEAELNYRIFLTLNSNSHLTSYTLYRLVVANYENSFTGTFFPDREVDRDMEPNRRLMLQFKRFFLLYPKSAYLPEVLPVHRESRSLLARYELMVGDFYVEREAFNSAIGRYMYLLRNFPEYPESDLVLLKLIDAYRANRQDQLADEMERIYQQQFLSGNAGGARAPGVGTGPASGEVAALPVGAEPLIAEPDQQ